MCAGASPAEQVGRFLLAPLTKAKPIFPSFSAVLVFSCALIPETPKVAALFYSPKKVRHVLGYAVQA